MVVDDDAPATDELPLSLMVGDKILLVHSLSDRDDQNGIM